MRLQRFHKKPLIKALIPLTKTKIGHIKPDHKLQPTNVALLQDNR
jgi:hypothetical protein